jgi:hypothetical protein
MKIFGTGGVPPPKAESLKRHKLALPEFGFICAKARWGCRLI